MAGIGLFRTSVLAALTAWATALAPAWCAPAAPASGAYTLSLTQLRARYAEPAARIMTVQGVEMYYVDEGSGPVVVLLHGSQGTLKTYDGVAVRLRSHYRVIRYDQPPTGLSGPVPYPLRDKPLYPVDLLEGLLKRLNVTHATFVGVSGGGSLAFFLAARRPDLVDRLILSNTPADPVDASKVVESAALSAANAQAAATGKRPPSFWRAFLEFYSGEPTRVGDALVREYYDINRRAPEKNPLALVAAMNDTRATQAALAGIAAPTLLVWGARDPLLTPAFARLLAGYLKSAPVSTVYMGDVGHYPPLEAPDRFAQIVQAYIEAATPISAIRTPVR